MFFLSLTFYWGNSPCHDLRYVSSPHQEFCTILKADDDHEVYEEDGSHEEQHGGGDDEDAKGFAELVNQLVR